MADDKADSRVAAQQKELDDVWALVADLRGQLQRQGIDAADAALSYTRRDYTHARDMASERVRNAAVQSRANSETARADEAELRYGEATEQLDAQRDDAALLHQISVSIIQEGDINTLYERILDGAISLMNADMGSMQILHPEQNELRLLTCRGFHPGSAAFWDRIDIRSAHTSCGVALLSGGRVMVPDCEVCDFMAGSADLDYYRLSGIRAVQSTPLVTRSGELLGMISTHWSEPHHPPESLLQLLDVLARQAADLIERTRNEEKLQLLASIFESSDDAVITKNLDGIITSWNQGAERIFGYSAEEAVGKPITILIPPERQDEEPAILARIRRGERIDHYETVRQRKHGSKIDISITVSPIRNVAGKIVGASKIARDITERKRAEAQIAVLVREAEHRARNVLATVQATVHLSQSDTPDGLKRSIAGRIQALANVNRLFVESRWTGADLRTLASEELLPYCQEGDERAQVDGKSVTLKPDVAQALAVILHELATNAAKYGALSVPGGRVHVSWSHVSDERLILRWTETGGPAAKLPTRQGFGTRVMKGMIGDALKGDIRLDWREAGLVCELAIPV
jgi:PAS domain S-box-containing protein